MVFFRYSVDKLFFSSRNLGGLANYKVDISNKGEVNDFFMSQKPDIVINCAAMANVDLCEEEKELCWKINVGGVKNLVDACKRHSTHLTHISTDYIFDGKKESGIYNEDDDPNPQGYYAKSKLEGESNVLKNFPLATILRPSVVYSVDDNFTTNFMTLLNRLPFFPLYYNGNTKFTPIHCSDLTDTIYHIISKNIYSKIIECVGPEEITFKEVLHRLLKLINKNRILIPLPLPLADMSARLFEMLPKPPLTRDQLRLLKYDNVLTGKYKSNSEIGVPSVRYFDEEVKKYCYMWRDGGQFSTDKYSSSK